MSGNPISMSGASPLSLRDTTARDALRQVRANKDFHRLLLAEFLRPLLQSMTAREDGGGVLQSGGLEFFEPFLQQAVASSLGEAWPLPDLPGTERAAVGAVAVHRPAHQAKLLPLAPTPALSDATTIAGAAGDPPREAAHLPNRDLARAARMFDLPVNLLRAVVLTESGGRANAVSSKGAVGLMQLMPETAKEMGVENPRDTWQNIFGGAKYLSRMITRFGDLPRALAAYNAGPGRVESAGGIPSIPETRAYVGRVLRWKARLDTADPTGA